MKFSTTLFLLTLVISFAGAQTPDNTSGVKMGVRTIITRKQKVVVSERTQHVKVLTHYAGASFLDQKQGSSAASSHQNIALSALSQTNTTIVHPRYGGPSATIVDAQGFGPVSIGGQPVTKILTYPLMVSNSTLSFALQAGVSFSIQSSSCTATQCTVQVAFAPSYPGLLTDAVSVTDSNKNLVYQTFVSGTGQGPQFGFVYGTENDYNNFASSPTGTAVGPDGRFYVMDRSNGEVTRVTFGGEVTSFQITNLCNPAGIAVDGAGTVYVADPTFNEVVAYSASGVQTVVQTTPLLNPTWVAVDATGALYISDTGNGRIIKLDNHNVESTVLSGLSSPQGLAVDADGNLYFGDLGNNGEIQELTASSGDVASIGTDLGRIQGIAVDASGRVYFTTSETFGVINRATGLTDTMNMDDDGPFSVAVAPNGNILTSQSRDGYFKVSDVSTGNFGLETQIQSTAMGMLTIANNGNTPLSLSSFSIGGPAYSIDSSTVCTTSTPLPVSNSCTVTLDFTPPTISDNYNDTFTTTTNSLNKAGSQANFSLFGTGDGASTYTTLSLSSQNAPAGANVTLTASVSPYSSGLPSPTGTVNFFDGDSQLGSGTLTSGAATFTTNSLSVGNHAVYAAYQGDSFNSGSTSPTYELTVGIGSTNATVSLSVSSTNLALNQPETLTVTVSSNGNVPTGTVTFLDNGKTLGTATLTGTAPSATASLTVSTLSGGSHALSASYSGDANYSAGTSNTETATVAQGGSSTTLTINPTNADTEHEVTLTATVTSGINPPEDGQVIFSDQNGTIGYASIEPTSTGGTATYQTFLSAGSHQVIANYTQDANYSDSISASQTVNVAQGTPYVNLNVSAANIKPGQTEILTFQLGDMDAFGEPGTVTFSDQNGVLGSGVACSCSSGPYSTLQLTSLSPGVHTITATYNGDSNYSSATGSPQTVTVSGNALSPTTITLSVSSSNVSPGDAETLTATIQGQTSPPESGTVTFADQNGTLGSVPVTASSTGATASLSLSTLSTGSHQITATYSGDTVYASSVSAPQTVSVSGGTLTMPTTTVLAVSSVNPALGSSERFTATVSANGVAPSGAVTFADQNGVIGTADLLVGDRTSTAVLTYSGLAFGSHQVTATYNGSTDYAMSTSSAQTVTVGPATSTTSLAVSPSVAVAGQAVTLVGTVQSYPNPALNGVISFADQNGPLGFTNITPNSTGGSASLTLTNLSAGSHQITAAYNNDYQHAYSISPAQVVNISPASSTPTSITLTVPASATYRSPITLRASVTGSNANSVTVGQVIFCDASAPRCAPELSLATAQLNSGGVAVARLSPGSLGTHTYVASFLGTSTLASSTSSSQTVTVTGIYPTTTTISSSGAPGNYSITGTVVGLGSRSVAPTGTVTFNDTTNSSNPPLGNPTLGNGTLGYTAAGAAGSPNKTAAGSYGVASGDFNGDGFADLAVENYSAGTVSILLGRGDGTFQSQVSYPVGSLPERVLVADFNGDGVADLVVANTGSNTVGVLLGNGDGTFRSQVTYAASSPVGLGVMDVNHDGVADIIAGDYYSNTISVLLGNGDGTFKPAVTYATGNTPQTLAEGDFNGDGNVDVAVGNFGDNTVGIFLGNGDGTFKPQVTYPVGRAPQGVQVGDFDGNGFDDLAVSNSTDNTISVLLGNGDGTFKPQVTYPVGLDPVGLVVADFDGDGKQDLSVGNTAQAALTQSILLGNGDGTFQPQRVYPTGNFPYGEVAADFNGDGFPDLAISNFSDGTATVLLSQITETATATVSAVSVGAPVGVHNVNASYAGDTAYAASASATIPLTNNAQPSSSTRLTISPASSAVGQTVVFSVSVFGTTQTTPVPTGTVTLTNAAVTPAATLGTITLDATGSGSLSTSSLAAGTYSVVATYNGDASYTASYSAPQTLTVANATGPIVNARSFGSVLLAATPATLNLTYNAPAGSTSATGATTYGTVFKAQSPICGNGVCSVQITFSPTYPGSATDALTVRDATGNLLGKTFLYGTGTAPQLGYNLAYGIFNTYSGTVKSPASVAVGPDSSLYVGDLATNQVYRVTSDNYSGGTALAIRALGKPAGIAIGGDGTLYVADQTNSVIRSFSTVSSAQTVVPTTALNAPTGVAVDGTGALYISDTGNGRIIRIDNQGAETTVVSGLTSPAGIALDSAGNLFYADANSGGEITEIASGTGVATPIGTNLGTVGDIAVAPSGRVYFATSKSISSILNGSVSSNGYFNLSGNPTNYGLALDRFQDVVATNTTGGVLAVTNRTGSSFTFGTPVGTTNTCCDLIENTGNSPLTVSTVTNSGANYALHVGGGECFSGQVLQPTQTCNVAVDFSPTAFQSYPDTVTVTSNSLDVAGSTNTSSLLETGYVIPTTTAVSVSPNPGQAGQPITFTARIAFNSTYAIPPTGTVKFVNSDGNTLATVQVNGVTAQYTTTTLAAGTYSVTATYSGDTAFVASMSPSQSYSVTALTPQTINFPPIPNHFLGDAPFALNATASSGLPVSYTVASGPAAISGSTITLTGSAGIVTVIATQAGNTTYAAAAPVSQSFSVTASGATVSGVSPASGVLGSPATTITLSGSNFNTGDVVQLNGSALATTYVGATTLSAVIPASFFAQSGTGQITVFDPSTRTTSTPITFTVANTPQVVFTGPSVSTSGAQPGLTFQLVNPYPVALSGALTLSFVPVPSAGVNDTAVQFATGGRTLAFNIPANSTITPAVQLQTGTVAGTATIALALTANGVNVTPASVVPVVVTIPPAAPTITSTAVTRSGNLLTVTMVGFSNTRETTQAVFHFVAIAGATINNPDVPLTVTPNFASYYSGAQSATYGSAFTYTQTFTLDQDANIVQGVSMTLANTIGTSSTATTP